MVVHQQYLLTASLHNTNMSIIVSTPNSYLDATTKLCTASANWNNGYTAYTNLTSNSANWQNTYTTFRSNSSTWTGTTYNTSITSTNIAGVSSIGIAPAATVTYNCANGIRYFYYNAAPTAQSTINISFTGVNLSNSTATIIKIALSSTSTETTFNVGNIDGITPVFVTPSTNIKCKKNTWNLIQLDVLKASNGTYSVFGDVIDVG